MAYAYLTDQSAGAPVLSGTNGALCAVLDWAVVQAGWAIEYTNGANARVYRPALGNRHRLHVNHDSAVSGAAYLATVRGCEGATSATALIDPFPTVAQVVNANATFLVSTAAGATARPYRIVVTDTLLLMFVATSSSNVSGWDMLVFGDVVPRYAGDTYGTLIAIGGTSTNTSSARSMANALSAATVNSGKLFWCRSVDGFTKSTQGALGTAFAHAITLSFCSVYGTPAMRTGYLGQIMRERISAHCNGSSTSTTNATTSVLQRGWIPNLWNPVHNGIGQVTSDDVFADTSYHASAQFVTLPSSSSIAVILETTNTWSAPSG